MACMSKWLIATDRHELSNITMTAAIHDRHTQRSTISDHTFAAAAPALWNSMLEELRSSSSPQLFSRRLKAELFHCYLGPSHSMSLFQTVT